MKSLHSEIGRWIAALRLDQVAGFSPIEINLSHYKLYLQQGADFFFFIFNNIFNVGKYQLTINPLNIQWTLKLSLNLNQIIGHGRSLYKRSRGPYNPSTHVRLGTAPLSQTQIINITHSVLNHLWVKQTMSSF